MKKFTILTSVAMLVVSSSALAQPGDGPRREREADITRQQVIERSAQRFDRLDIDNDGRLTAQEAQQARAQRREQHAGRVFERLDLDRNGSVTRTEFEQARGQLRERRAQRRPEGHRGGRSMRRGDRAHGLGRMMGEQGFLTREQFSQRALARFDRLDQNRDGTVTVTERRESFEARRAQRQERRQRPD